MACGVARFFEALVPLLLALGIDRIAEGNLDLFLPVAGIFGAVSARFVIVSSARYLVRSSGIRVSFDLRQALYAALQVLTLERGEPWLVLGDMKELGPSSRKMHAEMGEAASALGVKRLFAIGDVAEATVAAFGPGGTRRGRHRPESRLRACRRPL